MSSAHADATVSSAQGAPVGSAQGAPVGSAQGAPVGSAQGAPVGSAQGAPAGSAQPGKSWGRGRLRAAALTRRGRLAEARDPRQARCLTLASLRWVIRNRAWTPWHLIRYWRFFLFKLRNPHIVTEGFVFLGRNVDVMARPGYGRMVLGRFVHIGNGSAIRCHSGNLRIGDKCVFGKDSTVNAHLDIEFGEAVIVADWVYVCDFDHVFSDIHVPIKDQWLVKSPVRIGPDVWLGVKSTVLRGVTIGRGSVIAAHCLVNADVPPMSVAVGVPVRVVRNRIDDYTADAARREALADIARKTQAAARPVIEARAKDRA